MMFVIGCFLVQKLSSCLIWKCLLNMEIIALLIKASTEGDAIYCRIKRERGVLLGPAGEKFVRGSAFSPSGS